MKTYKVKAKWVVRNEPYTVVVSVSSYTTLRDSVIDKEPLEVIGNIYQNPELLN